MMEDKHLDVAKEAALEAAEIQRAAFEETSDFEYKHGDEIVTKVDYESESAIKSKIENSFPSHEVISEETNPDKDLHHELTWVVDPIDGTINFLHGSSQFCIGIALLDREGVKISVVHNPISGDMFTAVRDGGAELNGESIKVSENTRLSESLVAVSWSDREYTEDQIFEKLREIHESSHGIRKTGSAVLSMALTAAGVFDGYCSISLGKWDVAAGLLLVEEAGGEVTNLSGEDDHREIVDDSIIATNGHVHDRLRDTLGSLEYQR